MSLVEQAGFAILAEDGGDDRNLVLARGDSFALFDRHGDLRPNSTGRFGLFFDGTRFLSVLRVRLNQRRPLLLSSGTRGGNEGLSIHSTNPDVRDGDVLRLARVNASSSITMCAAIGSGQVGSSRSARGAHGTSSAFVCESPDANSTRSWPAATSASVSQETTRSVPP